jgi:hypothetical protein
MERAVPGAVAGEVPAPPTYPAVISSFGDVSTNRPIYVGNPTKPD